RIDDDDSREAAQTLLAKPRLDLSDQVVDCALLVATGPRGGNHQVPTIRSVLAHEKGKEGEPPFLAGDIRFKLGELVGQLGLHHRTTNNSSAAWIMVVASGCSAVPTTLVARLHLPGRHRVPEREVVVLDPSLLPRKAQQDVQLVGLETSVRLEFPAGARELRPVEGQADPELERDFHGVAAQIGGAVEAAGGEKHLGIVETGPSDVFEFRNQDHGSTAVSRNCRTVPVSRYGTRRVFGAQ